MADTDTPLPSSTDEEQSPKDSPAKSGEFAVGPMVMRRLLPSVDDSTLSNFFTQLTSIKENDHISVNFSSLLENTYAFSLRYTKQSYFDGEHPQEMYLFRSEVALIFYDWLIRQEGLAENLTAILQQRQADERAANALVMILNYCRNIGAGEQVVVDKAREQQFGQLLEEAGSVSAVAKFIIDYIDRPILEAEEETQKETAEEAATVGEAADAKTTPSGTSVAATDQEISEAGAPEEGTPPESPTPESPAPPIEPIPTTSLLLNADVKRETARLTQISLIQLEKFHNLPEGSLQNSPELRSKLTLMAQEFLAVRLTPANAEATVNNYSKRVRLIEEYCAAILHGPTPLRSEIARALRQTIADSADPQLKEKILAEIKRAESGENVSELFAGLANDPQIVEVIKNIQASKPLFQNDPAVINDQLSQELLQQLKDAGVHPDRIPLAYENIVGRLNAMADLGSGSGVLRQFSEQNWQLLFSEYAPYNPAFVEFLANFVEQKKVIGYRAEADHIELGKYVLTGDKLFAFQEAQRLLDENNPEITPQQSRQIFLRGYLEPTNKIIEDKRALGLHTDQTFAEAKSQTDQWQKNYNAYLQSLWNEFVRDEKQVAQFRQFAQYEVVPLQAPQELVVYLQSSQAGADYQVYENGYMRALSPLAGMGDFENQAQQFGKITQLAQGLGKGLFNRFGGKAAEKQIENQVGEIAGKAVEKAGSALPGGAVTGKALGWLAKNATTKEGRQKILAVGGGGLAGIITPLFTWGGRIGALIGGGLGGLLGSVIPGLGTATGAAGGGILGSWFGFRAQNSLKKFFGSGGQPPVIGWQGPDISGKVFSSGGLSSGGGLLTSTEAVVSATGTTASQAIMATVGVMGSVFLFTNMTFTGAFLADFPQVDPLSTTVPGTQGKQSEYVTIEKRVFVTGCPENKCENPAFPIKAEYSIIIRPKSNYSIAILSAQDSLRVNHSTKAWEEEGKSPPNIPEKIKTIDDIPELYEELTLNPGEEVAISYTETFDEGYNHSTVINTFEIGIFFSDPETGETGTDNAITGEVVYIGNYSQGAGCWPTNGTVKQLPDGDDSHVRVDAFDIANSEGTPIYAPFDGNLCVASLDPGYGNHLTLDSSVGKFVFGHFSRLAIGAGCQQIEAGELIGWMGNTGNSTGPHLHFELRGNRTSPSALGALMPDGLAIRKEDPVRTCYDGG
jgi:hypothetical protein